MRNDLLGIGAHMFDIQLWNRKFYTDCCSAVTAAAWVRLFCSFINLSEQCIKY